MRQDKCTLVAVVLSILALVIACIAGRPPEAEAGAAKGKMAMIFPGSIQDADWNAVGYVGLQEVGKAYDLQVSHSEQVPIGDVERVSREYINAGYDIIGYHSGAFPTIPMKLAPLFPKINFIQQSGRLPQVPNNIWMVGRKWYQGFYVLGVIGALSTKTNKVGYIGGVRIPDSVAIVNALLQALKEYNPSATLVHTHIGDFNDPVKARQVAEAQIAGGVDFIVGFVNLGMYGVVEAAKASQKPVLLTTFNTEKRDLAPTHITASLLTDFGTPYKEIVGRILKGERSGYYEMRPGSGMELSDIRNVPQHVPEKVKAIFKEVVAGKPLPEITDRVISP